MYKFDMILSFFIFLTSFSSSYCICIPWMQDPCFGAYSSITDLMFGFDETILQSAFGVCLNLSMNKLRIVYILLGKQDTNCVYLTSQVTLVEDILGCIK